MKVRLEINTYLVSHGHNPQGFGQWMFSAAKSPTDADLFDNAVTFSFTGRYGEAKKAAIAWGMETHNYVIYVMP